MKYTMLTAVVILLAAAPVATAQAPARQTGTVRWQYYAGTTAVGTPTQPLGTKANIRCSVIASDEEGAWVCLYVDAIPKVKLPDNKDADTCRPHGADGKLFKLTNSALLPDHDTTQAVFFISGSRETTYKLEIKKDGHIRFELAGPSFAGDTTMSGAVSVVWYVSKKK
jgi:hypothetical protein